MMFLIAVNTNHAHMQSLHCNVALAVATTTPAYGRGTEALEAVVQAMSHPRQDDSSCLVEAV